MEDMDRDGDGDALYSPSPGRLELVRRNADSTWTAVPVVTSGVQRVLKAVTEDFDRNGLPDVAAYVQRSTTETGILFVRQTSLGVFDAAGALYVNVGAAPAPLAPLRAVDVDLDGEKDLVLAWKTGTAATAQGRAGWIRYAGAATFGAPSAFFLQVFDAPCDVAAADFDRDGDVDIAVIDNGGELRVLPGPTFTPAAIVALPEPRHIEVLDYNQDGWLDLMTTTATLGTSPGSGLRVYEGGASGFSLNERTDFSYTTISNRSSMALGDYNLDGQPDVLLGAGITGSYQLLLGTNGGSAESGRELTPGIEAATGAVACYDDDHDGDADAFLTTSTGLVRLANTTPHRVLIDDTTKVSSANGTQAAGAAGYATGDLNGDGRPDVASATAADGTIRVFLHSGSALTSITVASNPNCRWLAAADFDGDGDTDLAAPSLGTNRVVWYANNGLGTSWTAHIIPYAVPTPLAITVGDINFDGRPDILTGSATGGAIHQLLNAGDGTWTGSEFFALAGVTRLEITDIAPGGRLEVAVQHGSGGAVSMIQFGIAGWTRRDLAPGLTGSGGEGLALGDLDGNGLTDVVQGFGDKIYGAFQTTSGVFGSPVFIGAGAEFLLEHVVGILRHVRTADLDLDGVPECVGVFEKGIGVFSPPRPLRGARAPVLLAKSATASHGDVAFLRFDDDAVPDVAHRSTTASQLTVDVLAAPVLTIAAESGWRLASTTNYPTQGSSPVVIFRLSATSWAWPGDDSVFLKKLTAHFRNDDAGLTPFDQARFSLYYAGFSLSEDLNQPSVPEMGTHDPAVSGLAAGPVAAGGLVTLSLTAPTAFTPGAQRQFYVHGVLGNLFAGHRFRVDLQSARHHDGGLVYGSVGGTTFPIPASQGAATARFIEGSLTPRQSWRFSHWNYPSDMGAAADYADPDLDGQINLLEYALGLNPKSLDKPRIDTQFTGNRFFLSFWSVEIQPDVRLELQRSTSLAGWFECAVRGVDGFWDTVSASDLITDGSVNGSLLQQVFSTPRLPSGREFFQLSAVELVP